MRFFIFSYRTVLLAMGFFITGVTASAQSETVRKPLVVNSSSNTISLGTSGSLLDNNKKNQKMLRYFGEPVDLKTKPKTIDMTAGSDLRDPGEIYDKKFRKDKEIKPSYMKDQYLGDFKSNASYVRIVCRDHEFVDGDRVQLSVNDIVTVPDIWLDYDFKTFDIALDKGFNRIDFQALNQGASGPNTAEFRVYDDKGNLVTANEWNLTTGVKATLIIVKEE